MNQASLFEDVEQAPQVSAWITDILNTLDVEEVPGWPDYFGRSIRTRLQDQHQPIKTLSLFSGGGGLDIAFHDLGFRVLEMVEIDSRYAQTLRLNAREGGCLEGSRVVCQDIRDYHPAPDLKVDFIIGGPPCQTFSAAGRRAAGVAGTTDPRGTLFEEYVRLLKTLEPQGFLFENVYGITGAQNGEAWTDIQAAFRAAGYTIRHRILDAADYGVPQHRERLFIVGVRDQSLKYRFPTPTHGPDSPGGYPYYTAALAVAQAGRDGMASGIGGRYGQLLEDIPPGLNYSFYTKEMGYPYPVFSWRSKFSDFLYKADPDMPVRTLKAQGGQYTGPFHWENRKFSLKELKRLQTFPDAYEIEGGAQVSIQQLGNSVPPQLGRMLGLSILEQVFGVVLPFEMRYLEPDQELGFRQRKRTLTERYSFKAQQALERLKREGRLLPPSNANFREGQEQRFLSPNFSWTTQSPGVPIHLEFRRDSKTWIISAGIEPEGETVLEMRIEPVPDHPWVLDVEAVRLIARDSSDHAFTALWKAFEERLLEYTGKADLVQLNGYYQYAPRIRVRVIQHDHAKERWETLARVLQGEGIAMQLNSARLALLWGCAESSVPSFLQWLRNLGFEVRNRFTNPQIPPGEYLVPYAFPTLTPRSVQLRKQLVGAA